MPCKLHALCVYTGEEPERCYACHRSLTLGCACPRALVARLLAGETIPKGRTGGDNGRTKHARSIVNRLTAKATPC